MITFNEIPSTRVPGQYAEFNTQNAQQGLSALNYKVLGIGQGTDAGSASAKTLYLVTSPDQAGGLFGFGSQLHLMAVKYFQNNLINELKMIAATMDPIATPTNKSTGSIQITSAATADGVLYLYIAGQRILVTVASGDTVNTIAAAINTELANYPNLPVTHTVATDTVTLVAKNIGVTGDSIDIRFNYQEGENDPAGVAYTITAMNAGAADPDISSGSPSVIDQLGDQWWQIIMTPYTDATNWTALQTELDRRFGATVQVDGVAITAKVDTQTNLVTFGSGKNTKQICCAGIYDVMQQPLEIAAAIAGQVAGSLAAGNGNEARPFQTLELVGINAPREERRFTFLENDVLLKNGIATLLTDAAGKVRIQRLITTWQTNAQSDPDTTWLDANIRFTAMFIRWDWVQNLLTKYPRAKLADDGVRVGPGQQIITPKVAKAEAIARFTLWEEAGLVEDFASFKAGLIAERDGSDVNAMNWFMPTDFINQFRVGKSQIGVIL